MDNLFSPEIWGQYVKLRKIVVQDAEQVFKWRSGPSGKYLRNFSGYSVESQKEWISLRKDNEINYIITDSKTGVNVGTIGIYDVSIDDRVANVGRLLLDEVWLAKSNPYGLEAMLLCYDFVFNKMEYRKITGDILGSNESMIKLQKYLGMIEEGVLKQHLFLNGKFEDLHIMSLFSSDFEKAYKKRIQFLLKSFNSK
ncbi:MAG: GNAT family N-acetyltransferase [Chitinophagaceae bacterium]|nr:GNAT family N-acetyltransferase [Chitinophagaceae bacterium]